jgi:hypothetical protein
MRWLGGIEDAKRLLPANDGVEEVVNRWTYLAPGIGNFGTNYLLRANKATDGLFVLEPGKAMYMRDAGEPLDGSRSYRLYFASDNLPHMNAFWSLSMYEVAPDGRRFFTENPSDDIQLVIARPDGSATRMVRWIFIFSVRLPPVENPTGCQRQRPCSR